MKKLIWVMPLSGMLFLQFFAGGMVSAADCKNILNALVQFGPKLALNTLLTGMAIIIILLCGMRIYGFIFSRLQNMIKLKLSAGLLIFFITGALFTFGVMMTIGLMGIYYPVWAWMAVLLAIFFPIILKFL